MRPTAAGGATAGRATAAAGESVVVIAYCSSQTSSKRHVSTCGTRPWTSSVWAKKRVTENRNTFGSYVTPTLVASWTAAG